MPLPIDEHREAIKSALAAHDCVIIVGDTGSGKTTQLPRILNDAGFDRVCISTPRRVAAVSAARRVAEETGCHVGERVGYAIRFEHKTSDNTRITFATDGVVLRQAVRTPSLDMYDALVLDEAHERSLNTDVLFALAKRVLSNRRRRFAAASKQRRRKHQDSSSEGRGEGGGEGGDDDGESGSHHFATPAGGLQRVVVASATLDAAKLSAYFYGAPVLRVPGTCFPVRIMHISPPTSAPARSLGGGGRTALIESALEVVLRVHASRPAGPAEDVLVFCTGQDEISTAAHALRELAREVYRGSGGGGGEGGGGEGGGGEGGGTDGGGGEGGGGKGGGGGGSTRSV